MKIIDLKEKYPLVYQAAMNNRYIQRRKRDDVNLLSCSFTWQDTPEKNTFWYNINLGKFKEAEEICPHLFVKDMKTTLPQNNLPKYWVVKRPNDCELNPKWKKVIDYLNTINPEGHYTGLTHNYYGVDGSAGFLGTNCHGNIANFINNPIELSLDEFIRLYEGKDIKEFTPISMKCSQEQYDLIKPKLDKLNLKILNPFYKERHCYLLNNFGEFGRSIISIGGNQGISNSGGKVYEIWNEQIFLESLGVDLSPLYKVDNSKSESMKQSINTKTQEEYYALMEWCNDNNITWSGDEKASSRNIWNTDKENTCINLNLTSNKKLSHCSKNYYIIERYEIISFEDFAKQKGINYPTKTNPSNKLILNDVEVPQEIVELMLQRQAEQGNPRNLAVFQSKFDADKDQAGFTWENTPEKGDFWNKILNNQEFNVFFEKYPKKNKWIEEKERLLGHWLTTPGVRLGYPSYFKNDKTKSINPLECFAPEEPIIIKQQQTTNKLIII